jgi:outer membrane protein insertion porin family
MGINTPVDAQRGTVDIEYELEEKPSDQLELSAGWGGVGRGIVGTLGVTFNNFSLRGLVNGNDWNPVPQGDGQRLSLRAQTNGRFYQSFNMSFTEPWLGGKKPNSLNVGAYYTRQSNGLSSEFISGKYISLIGGSVGFGTRLKKPDDFFVATTSLNLQNITLRNYGSFTLENGITLQQGTYNNFSISQVLSRNSISDPIFPTSGSRITLTANSHCRTPYSEKITFGHYPMPKKQA